MSAPLRPIPSDHPLATYLNPWLYAATGVAGGQIKLSGHDGIVVDPRTGVASGATNYALDVRSAVGLHVAVAHSGTSASAARTTANSVVLVQDDYLAVGMGKALRVYETGGTDYAALTSADGALALGGSGANAGLLTLDGNIAWKSGTAFSVTLDHAATANRIVTVQDLAGTVALLDAANVGSLLFADNAHDIGAAGATRPRSLYLGTSASVGAAPAAAGAIRISNSTAISTRNGANLADLILVQATAGNIIQFAPSSASIIQIGATNSTLAFWGQTAVARPAAITQTYATAIRTHANPTAATVTNAFGSQDGTYQDTSATSAAIANNFQECATKINQLIVDIANVKQVLNAVVDDLQSLGLEQ